MDEKPARDTLSTGRRRPTFGVNGYDVLLEPVIRHVTLALAALEATEASAADPYHAMRVEAEITGPWVSVLRHLLGKSPAELHDLPLWIGR